ncbi:MAG TPA: aminoglycoside phosphotransferase family protein [Acidimicrobiales bacterium]|nr:aminoglycoside phosphotransferase family protein [Acidimicrobiales bacterium]
MARASGGPDEVQDVTVEVVYEHGAASATAGIWRYSIGDWSVVLKLLRHGAGGSPAWQSGEDPGHWYYWRREADAFSSRVLRELVLPLRAPRSYGVFDRSDGSCAVWLEDLRSIPSAAGWEPVRYRAAAHHLGRAQGHLARAGRLPEDGWLGRDWLRRYVERREVALGQIEDPTVWNHPLVRELLPPETRDECRAIWQAREELLAVIESMPLTLVHCDLHPGNMFGADGETVLIDWGFVGRGPVGEDPGNLIFDAIWDFFVDPGEFKQLRTAVVQGYVAGLSESGWDGDAETVVRAITAVGAVKFFWIPPAMANAAATGSSTLNRRPFEEAFRQWAQIVPEIFAARRAVTSGPPRP